MNNFVTLFATGFCLFAASLSAQDVSVKPSTEIVKKDKIPTGTEQTDPQGNEVTTVTNDDEVASNQDCGCKKNKKKKKH